MSYDMLIPADNCQPMMRFQKNSLGVCRDLMRSPGMERLMGDGPPSGTFIHDPRESVPNIRARALATEWGIPDEGLCGDLVFSPLGIIGASRVEKTFHEAAASSGVWHIRNQPYIRPENPLLR